MIDHIIPKNINACMKKNCRERKERERERELEEGKEIDNNYSVTLRVKIGCNLSIQYTERDTLNGSSTVLAIYSFFYAQERLNCYL